MLPTLLPMLATPARPFDSPEYCFEVKWDGVRALAAVEATRWRLWGRGAADYTARYPELAVLRRWPAGTLVDGELVAFGPDGRCDLALLLNGPLTRSRKPRPLGQSGSNTECVPQDNFPILVSQAVIIPPVTLCLPSPA